MKRSTALALILLIALLSIACPDRPTIVVKTCAVTGLIPNQYCPNVVERKFYLGEEPTAICSFHNSGPGPQPQPTPTVRVFTGTYDIMGATGNLLAYLDKNNEAEAYGHRYIVVYSWNGPQSGGSPYVVAGSFTRSNGLTFAKYSLTQWDEAYWSRFRALARAIMDRGQKIWIVAEDFNSLEGDSREKYWNPFYCSVEALSPSTPGGVWGESMKHYHALLFQKIINELHGVGVSDFFMEPMNEFNIVDGTDSQRIAWHKWAVEKIIELGVPRERIIATGKPAVEIAKETGFYSPHRIGEPSQIVAQGGIPTAKVIFSSDGFYTGRGDCDAKGRCGVGVDVAAEIGRRLIALGAFAFERLPRGCYRQNNNRADLDLFDPGPSREMAFAK